MNKYFVYGLSLTHKSNFICNYDYSLFKKLKRQEELMKRQSDLQKEIAAKKREENELKLAEKRGGREPRVTSVQPRETRGRSPPIPTLREKEDFSESSNQHTGARSAAR